MESGYVNFELKLPRGASVGLYARRNALPTHTNYDLMEVIKGLKDSDKGSSVRSTRALKVSFVVLCSFYKISNYIKNEKDAIGIKYFLSYVSASCCKRLYIIHVWGTLVYIAL